MTNSRRAFLKNTALTTGALLLNAPFKQFSALASANTAFNTELNTLHVFHTNDLHNQVLPLRSKYGYGGILNINSIVKKNQPHILVDAGDFLDDKASKEDHLQMIHHMNHLGYSAVTIGNKELASGEDHLALLVKEMNFKLVNCNYSFTHPHLKSKVQRSHIIQWGSYKIGITGVGPEQLPASSQIKTHHPYKRANATAYDLKKEQGCDLVICLSHLGIDNQQSYNNIDFAKASENIDLIVSGHGNQLTNAPKVVRNSRKEQVIVSHGGWGGLVTRQLSVHFNENKAFHSMNYRNYAPSAHSSEPFHQAYKRFS